MGETESRAENDVLQPAADIDSFLREPRGRFVLRRAFAFWQLQTGMNGVIVWGSPDVHDVEEMTRVFDVAVHHPSLGRHVSLVDTRDISGIDSSAFEKLLDYLDTRRDLYARYVSRQALVVRRGVFGAALAGFYELVDAKHPTKSFTDVVRAIDWLEPPDRELALRVFNSMYERVRGTPETVARIRSLIEAERRAVSLVEAARRLALSPRTLQRRLTEANTSMRRELSVFRLRTVERLLTSTTLPLEEIAKTVGSTAVKLTKLFREVHGLTPRSFRAHRAQEASREKR